MPARPATCHQEPSLRAECLRSGSPATGRGPAGGHRSGAVGAHRAQQNFEIIIDDKAALAEIGRVRSGPTTEFIRENYAQPSLSEES